MTISLMTFGGLMASLGAVLILAGIFWMMWNMNSNVAVATTLIGVVIILTSAAMAHDQHRPELTPWFKELQSKKGEVCCDGTDGTRLGDVDWESNNGKYRVRIEGQWIDVPDDAVVEGPNRAGHTLVWPYKGYMGTTIRCFMPGSMT